MNLDVEERLGVASGDTHPITRAAMRLGGEGRVALIWAAVAALLVFATPEDSALPLLGIAVFIGGLAATAHRSSKIDEQREELHDLQVRFAEGEIDLDEFEERLEVVLDPRARRVRDYLDDEVNGIGPVLAGEVALRYLKIEDLREADAEELEEIHGIGEERAAAIVDELEGAEPPEVKDGREALKDAGFEP